LRSDAYREAIPGKMWVGVSIIAKVERQAVEEGKSPTIGLFVFSALPRGGEKVMIDRAG
jgi:hypothetical protein